MSSKSEIIGLTKDEELSFLEAQKRKLKEKKLEALFEDDDDQYQLSEVEWVNRRDPRRKCFWLILSDLVDTCPALKGASIRSVQRKFKNCYYLRLNSTYDPVMGRHTQKDDYGRNTCSFTVTKNAVTARSFHPDAAKDGYSRSRAEPMLEGDYASGDFSILWE